MNGCVWIWNLTVRTVQGAREDLELIREGQVRARSRVGAWPGNANTREHKQRGGKRGKTIPGGRWREGVGEGVCVLCKLTAPLSLKASLAWDHSLPLTLTHAHTCRHLSVCVTFGDGRGGPY